MLTTLDSTKLLQSTLNALPAHAALLDGRATVIASNDYWKELGLGRHPPIPPTRVGMNYLRECEAAEAKGSGEAGCVVRGLRALLQTSQLSFHVEYSLSGTTPRFLRLRANRSGENGETRMMLWHEDVTESRRVLSALHESEDQLRQAQHAATLGRLVTGVAHNFNNMLTALLGYTDTLALRMENDAQSMSQVARVRKTALRAASVAQQLLDFGRKGAAKTELIDLNAIVLDLRELIELVCGNAVRVSVNSAGGACWIRADVGQIEQIVVNLALNARDAMPSGGTLTIETARLRCVSPAGDAGEFVVLSVADTGTGIDASIRARLFEPFVTSKAPNKGSGLGLYSVDRIVRRFGGFITVESRPERGAKFIVHLPAAGRGGGDGAAAK